MAAKQQDKYANIALGSQTMLSGNAVNTLLPTAININEKVGWILHRVEFDHTAAAANWTVNERLVFGIAASPQVHGVHGNALTIPSVHGAIIRTCLSAYAANLCQVDTRPFLLDFSDLPSGGKLVPPQPLYIFSDNIGMGAPGTLTFRIYYTQIALSTEEYWEMVETYRTISV
jgi:hypothetical protein